MQAGIKKLASAYLVAVSIAVPVFFISNIFLIDAIMRKLLLQLNAVARRGAPWQPDYQPIT